MYYNFKDYVSDYIYTTTGDSLGQNYQSKDLKWHYIKKIKKVNPFFELILFCDKIIRVSSSKKTPYKIHKSYPSARSFYPLKLWLSVGEGYFITNDNISGDYSLYYSNKFKLPKNTVLITNNEINLSNYKPIHKTLESLEIGHLIYNLFEVYNIFGHSFTVDNTSTNYTTIILKEQKNILNNKNRCQKIHAFKEKAYLRNSGNYLKKINNFDLNSVEKKFEINLNLREIYSSLYNTKESHSIIITHFFNDVNGSFSNSKVKIPYYKLNKEYGFINFRTCSQYTLISLETDFYMNKTNYINDIQFIGFIAQNICLNNSSLNFYNRPVKQVSINSWNNDFLKEQEKKYLPMYGVISGWES